MSENDMLRFLSKYIDVRDVNSIAYLALNYKTYSLLYFLKLFGLPYYKKYFLILTLNDYSRVSKSMAYNDKNVMKKAVQVFDDTREERFHRKK